MDNGSFCLAASAVLLFMTMTVRRLTRDLVRWFTVAARKPSV